MVRYYDDEPVRHKLIDLTGDLALLGYMGNQGLPVGHVLAYKANHAMHIEFARALLDACEEDDYVLVHDVLEMQEAEDEDEDGEDGDVVTEDAADGVMDDAAEAAVQEEADSEQQLHEQQHDEGEEEEQQQ